MFYEEHLYLIALRQCNNLGNANLRKLINNIGSAKQVWESTQKKLMAVDGIGKVRIKDIGKPEFIRMGEKELLHCEKHGISMVSLWESGYPKHLQNCDDAPVLLFYQGNLSVIQNTISIVGTRKLTSYGKTFIQEFLSELRGNPICTVSGLALGADTCAHEESLSNNIPTVAVLAQSLNSIYPAANKKLARQILENNGVLMTEYASFDGASKEYFLQRNRIIAGLSPHLVVVETAYGGGSVTTVNCANSYNRDVFALPGKITDIYSQGCNMLIAQNKAESIVNIKTLVQNLNLSLQPQLFPEEQKKQEINPAQKDHLKTLEIIRQSASASLDEIAEKTAILHHKLLPILLDLELYGYIKCLSGRQYQII